MKIKIKKARSTQYWYSNSKYIGKVYEVIESMGMWYRVIDGYILKEDCEVLIDYTIPGTKLPPIEIGMKYRLLLDTETIISEYVFRNPHNGFISFGSVIFEDQIYIKCEDDIYKGDNYYYILLSDILDQNEENMNKVTTITPEQAKSIIDIACDGWKKKLANKWATNIVLNTLIEVTDEFISEMKEAATENQNVLLNTIFSPEINLRDLSTVGNKELFLPNGDEYNTLIAIRNGCKYTNKAFHLNRTYDWKIEKDKEGILCLIPSKRK